MEPRLIPLAEVGADPVGGKAAQLARLIRIGLRVPDGFVIVGATAEHLPPELDEHVERLAGDVAVRSSALSEDSATASHAGQYESVLGVRGPRAVREAIVHCLRSVASQRAQAYRSEHGEHGDAGMAVVVQRMVDARVAGVVFTADPVSGDRSRVVIDAVPGSGEGLVGGHVPAQHFVLSRDGAMLEAVHGAALLDAGLLQQLLRGALKAEQELGSALDLEWAVARDGQLYWLQARPITTLGLPGMDELDDPVEPTWQVTTHNVAEGLPGAIPPLSASVFGPAYNAGLAQLYLRAGLPKDQVERLPLIVMVQGHPFINLTNVYLLASQLFGADKAGSDISITGRVQPDAWMPPPASPLQRLIHTIRYFRMLPQARPRLDVFVAANASLRIEPPADLQEHYQRLEQLRLLFFEAIAVHAHVSQMGMALLGLFQMLMSGGGPATPASHAAVAALLTGAGSENAGAEESSIGVAVALDRLGRVIAEAPGAAENFVRAEPAAALAWLRSGAAGDAHEAFERFLGAHGHRCVGELDFRERDWAEDPLPLVASLQHIAQAPPRPKLDGGAQAQAVLAALSPGARRLAQWLLPRARAKVVERERSKSFAVWIARRLKRGYVDYAERLVRMGRLPDADLVYFFMHAELARFAAGAQPELVMRAQHRRRLYPRQQALEFPRVCQGRPAPLIPGADEAKTTQVIQGTPISRGIAIGRARVCRTIDDAANMEPGEILVTPFIDVGWTPFFSRAAGLAAEIGSVLSHGAVVAREYGLPAVAGLPGVTRRFQTGDMLRLDGDTGQLRRVE